MYRCRLLAPAMFFPVRRIYCISRHHAAHAREMGSDPTRAFCVVHRLTNVVKFPKRRRCNGPKMFAPFSKGGECVAVPSVKKNRGRAQRGGVGCVRREKLAIKLQYRRSFSGDKRWRKPSILGFYHFALNKLPLDSIVNKTYSHLSG